MAKKKVEAPVVDEVAVETVQSTEIATDVPVDTTTDETTTESPSKDSETQTIEEQSIPANIQRILKIFKNMPELYVKPTGGVFTPDTKPSIRGNAILYKNPFYNSK